MASLEKVVNFRPAGDAQLTTSNGSKVKKGMLYRSARLNSATTGDKAVFKRLGIKSIVDMRGPSHYSKLSKRPMEELYTPLFIKNGVAKEQSPPQPGHVGYLYVVDIIGKRYGLHVMQQVNWFLWLFSLLLIPIDFLFGTALTIHFYVKHVVNKMEVWQHYIDVLEHSKPEIAEVLRLVSDTCNLPALLHCELGKDRTGYTVALILSCVGVDDDVIIKDYARTEVCMQLMLIMMIYTFSLAVPLIHRKSSSIFFLK